jgi:hypothetical protein
MWRLALKDARKPRARARAHTHKHTHVRIDVTRVQLDGLQQTPRTSKVALSLGRLFCIDKVDAEVQSENGNRAGDVWMWQ